MRVQKRGMRLAALAGLSLVGSIGASGSAQAQQADENAVKSAQDAFGTKVGSETVGLYGPTSARGFNPMQAGNVRLEGLYFDQKSFAGRAMAKSTTMRVGLSAQSYPFPAPTGIADIALALPEDKLIISAAQEVRRPTGLTNTYGHLNIPLTENLAMTFAASTYQARSEAGAHGRRFNTASFLRWRSGDSLEIIPFFFYQRAEEEEVTPSMYSGGNYLPPRYDRGTFFGQDWADRAMDEANYGLIARGNATSHWRLQAGIFGSDQERASNYVVNYRNIQPNGVGDLSIQKYPLHDSFSVSGEVRASGVYTTGDFRHTIHIATRGRETTRIFGGGHTVNFGQATLGVYNEVAKPNYILRVRDKDVVHQYTPGVSYAGQWASVGEFSVGLQKSFYDHEFGKENVAPATSKSQPWLYNGSVAVNATKDLVFYASYTRGIEEFGTAPDSAANAGEPLPADVTKQVDAGLYYSIMPGLNFSAGIFEITKPYFDRNLANVYESVGQLSHKGVELSLAGRPFTGLNVVAGMMFLKARVSGLPVEQGLIAARPPGILPRFFRVDVQYGLPSWNGFAIEAGINSEGSQSANQLNTLHIPTLTLLSAGIRWNFAVGKVKANLRVNMNNVTNKFAWTVDGNSGRFAATPARSFGFRLAADFEP